MGTDIHMFVEKRNADGVWQAISGPNPLIEDYKGYVQHFLALGEPEKARRYAEDIRKIMSGEKAREEQEKYGWGSDFYGLTRYEGWLFNHRNYDTFAILADVRNGHGFAGVVTGEGFNPISEPKGLPKDMSEYLEQESKDYDHSASWLTLRELEEYDWNQVTTHSGVVSQNEYKVWKEKGKPESWSGGVSGGAIQHISNEEMDDLISGKTKGSDGIGYYTHVSWVESYKESAAYFYEISIPRLKELAYGDSDSVRIVFWFDS